MTDLKVLDTVGLLDLMDSSGVVIPLEIIARLDARGKHMFQAHSLWNCDPTDEVVHARSMFKAYDAETDEGWPVVLVDIPRQRWEDMPDYYLTS